MPQGASQLAVCKVHLNAESTQARPMGKHDTFLPWAQRPCVRLEEWL